MYRRNDKKTRADIKKCRLLKYLCMNLLLVLGCVSGTHHELGVVLCCEDLGDDGLDFIRSIIASAPRNLTPGGRLLFEADPDQMEAIKLEFEKYKYNDIIIRKDLAGRDRVIAGCYCGKD